MATNPKSINVKFLEQFPEFIEFRKLRYNEEEKENIIQTPQESLEYGYQNIRRNLSQELIALVKQCSPDFLKN